MKPSKATPSETQRQKTNDKQTWTFFMRNVSLTAPCIKNGSVQRPIAFYCLLIIVIGACRIMALMHQYD